MMNNFELFRRATILSDTESAYQLAKRVVELEEYTKELEKALEKQQEESS